MANKAVSRTRETLCTFLHRVLPFQPHYDDLAHTTILYPLENVWYGRSQSDSGPGGRWFKSIRPDHFSPHFVGFAALR
jgi:hypothetical protein